MQISNSNIQMQKVFFYCVDYQNTNYDLINTSTSVLTLRKQHVESHENLGVFTRAEEPTGTHWISENLPCLSD